MRQRKIQIHSERIPGSATSEQVSKSLQALLANCSPAKQPSRCSSAAKAKRSEPEPGSPPSPTGAPVTGKRGKEQRLQAPLTASLHPEFLPSLPILIRATPRPRGAPRIASDRPSCVFSIGHSRAIHDPVWMILEAPLCTSESAGM